MTGASLFRGVDRAVFVSSFAQKLRDAGVTVGISAEASWARALQACRPSNVTSMYWVTRPCLVHRHEDIAVFDQVFAAVFDAAGLPIAPWERDAPRAMVKMGGTMVRNSAPTDGFALATERMQLMQRPEVEGEHEASDSETDDVETVLPELVPAHLAQLADTPFDELNAADLDQIGAWMEEAINRFPERTGRRWKRQDRASAIDMRRTIRSALGTAAEPIRLQTRARRPKPRRVVMLADVSGSMESFARVYLHLMRVLVRRREADVFTFTTSLRRVTVPLRDDNTHQAIDRLCEEVEDRFSGTRIGTSVAALASSPVWSHSVRGATVVIASDGWDTDHPADLAKSMARLNRMAYRVIWVNPRSAAAGFSPTTGGMAAAGPYLDEFLSGHSLIAMRDVINAIAR